MSGDLQDLVISDACVRNLNCRVVMAVNLRSIGYYIPLQVIGIAKDTRSAWSASSARRVVRLAGIGAYLCMFSLLYNAHNNISS